MNIQVMFNVISVFIIQAYDFNVQSMRQFLIFGGNGFIGFEFLSKILENSSLESKESDCTSCQPQYHTTLVNRGHSWDWDKLSLLEKYCKSITRIQWDRKQPLKDCGQLVKLFREVQYFTAVVDFSAYSKSTLKESLSFVKGKCSLYIYISSDSIYEVCEKRHSGLTRETDAVRPAESSERTRLNRLDKYGHKKLECEELLAQQEGQPDSVPYVIFRLPDVFGARDSTQRLWQYLVWMKLCDCFNVPLYVPEQLTQKSISLVYVCDVASLLVRVIFSDTKSEFYQQMQNQSFNLAASEQIMIGDLLNFLSEKLGVGGIRIQFSASHDIPLIYPSVNLGPIDSSKARRVLSWQPSVLHNALRESVQFYQSIMESDVFSEEKLFCIDEVLDNLKGIYDVEPLRDRTRCLETLKEMLHVK